MKLKTQTQAVVKMEKESRKALRALEDSHANALLSLWYKARIDLQSIVAREYAQDFSEKDGDGHAVPWHLAAASARGTLHRIFQGTKERLGQFDADAKNLIRAALREVYHQEALRSVWMLDQTTPPSYVVKFPSRIAREGAAARDYKTGWGDALTGWLQSYQDTLEASLRLDSMHEGDIQDATNEVLKAKIGGYDPAAKFSALFANQALQEQQDARDSVVEDNADLVLEEIWMTMEDAAVCPICDKYDGQPYQDVDDEIPAHFNCRCYTRIVPRKWAELLRGGDPTEKEDALKMDDAGLVPDSMVVRGEHGDIVAHFTVNFAEWTGNRAADLYGQNIAGTAGADLVR